VSGKVPTIRIRAIENGSAGPLLGPFTIESCGSDADGRIVSSVVGFSRWVADGITFYGNKGGVEKSSLLKTRVMECLEELEHDDPEVAAILTGLVIVCNDLPASVVNDPMWQLHRAILATLPSATFLE